MQLFDFYKYPIAVGCKVSPSRALVESAVPLNVKMFNNVIVFAIDNHNWISTGGGHRYYPHELKVTENELGQPVSEGRLVSSIPDVSHETIEPSEFVKSAEDLYQRLISAPILATEDGTLFLDMINLIKDMSAKLDKIR